MSYIGKEPTVGNFQKCDAISVVNGQASYTLQVSGTNVVPESVNHMLVSLNGILQAPTDSFTVSGSTLTFASNLATGDVIDFVMILGNVLDLGVPSDNTVSLAKLTATGTKDATTFLRGDNTFASAGGDNTPNFYVTKSANQSISANTWTKITLDQELFDSDNVFASDKFTVPSAGKYVITITVRCDTPNGGEHVNLALYKNGAFFNGACNDRSYANTNGHELFLQSTTLLNLAQNDYL